MKGLYVQEAHVFRLAGDKAATRGHVVAHEDGEQLVGALGILDINAAQNAGLGVECGLPQLRRRC